MAKITTNASLVSLASTFTRTNGQPLDGSTLYSSKSEAEAYAKTDVAYVGQIITIVSDEEVQHYTIKDEAGTLELVGTGTISDEQLATKLDANGWQTDSNGKLFRNGDGRLEINLSIDHAAMCADKLILAEEYSGSTFYERNKIVYSVIDEAHLNNYDLQFPEKSGTFGLIEDIEALEEKILGDDSSSDLSLSSLSKSIEDLNNKVDNLDVVTTTGIVFDAGDSTDIEEESVAMIIESGTADEFIGGDE